MNNTTQWIPRLVLVCAVSFTLACGAASQAAATEAPPEVKVQDIASARLHLKDLPEVFEPIPAGELNEDVLVPSEYGFEPGPYFGFINPNDFQLVIGMNFVFSEGLEEPDALLTSAQQEALQDEFIAALGLDNVRQQEGLEILQTIGESRAATTMIADFQGTPMQIDIMILQRDAIVGMFTSMYPEGERPRVSLDKLGTSFDSHIQETLAALP